MPMDEDVLSDVIPSNIVSRQASNLSPFGWQYIHRVCHVGRNSKARARTMERASTLMAARAWKKTNFRATRRTRSVYSFVYGHRTLQVNVLPLQEPVASGSSPSKSAKMQQSAERQQKKQKRMADESQLHAKRQEMDKAKVSSSLQFMYCVLIVGRSPTL